MADNADRRTCEVPAQDSPRRRRYHTSKSQGICAYCSREAVLDRTVCYGCVDRQQIYNLRSMARRFLSRKLAAQVLAEMDRFMLPKRRQPVSRGS